MAASIRSLSRIFGQIRPPFWPFKRSGFRTPESTTAPVVLASRPCARSDRMIASVRHRHSRAARSGCRECQVSSCASARSIRQRRATPAPPGSHVRRRPQVFLRVRTEQRRSLSAVAFWGDCRHVNPGRDHITASRPAQTQKEPPRRFPGRTARGVRLSALHRAMMMVIDAIEYPDCHHHLPALDQENTNILLRRYHSLEV